MMEPLVEKWRAKHGVDCTNYYIRNVPNTLHYKWKSLAEFMGVNMHDIVLEALEAYIAAQELRLKELREEIRLGPARKL